MDLDIIRDFLDENLLSTARLSFVLEDKNKEREWGQRKKKVQIITHNGYNSVGIRQ